MFVHSLIWFGSYFKRRTQKCFANTTIRYLILAHLFVKVPQPGVSEGTLSFLVFLVTTCLTTQR